MCAMLGIFISWIFFQLLIAHIKRSYYHAVASADRLSMCVHADEATSHRLIMCAATVWSPITLLRDETRTEVTPP